MAGLKLVQGQPVVDNANESARHIVFDPMTGKASSQEAQQQQSMFLSSSNGQAATLSPGAELLIITKR